MDTVSIIDRLVSHAQTLGLFERVNQHEPKNAPGNGLSYALWVQSLIPLPGASGLATTTGRLEVTGRIYTSMTQQPPDMIDPNMTDALDKLINQYSGDFDLGGTVKHIDLLGEHGEPLQGNAGYLNIDNKILRVITVTIPIIVNDIWVQVS